ncbi:MAG: hypothetical protein Q9M28_01145 [Mariprofundaceae bacterium]|nr:hypothetical protein [Mariprofundaceae bacterium]
MKKTILLIMMLFVFGGVNKAWSEVGAHMHVAVLFIDNAGANFDFPKEISGEDVMAPLHGKAEILSFTHSANIKDGDVQNIQNDTLRFDKDENMQDFGVNCSLSMSTESGWSVAGLCKVFLDGKEKSKTHVIPHVKLLKQVVWYQLFIDKENHIVAGCISIV